MKKTLMIVLVAAMVVFQSVCALAAEEKVITFKVEEEKSVLAASVGFDAYSRYIGSVSGAEFYDGPVLQPSFTVSHNKTGIYANVWTSYAPKEGYGADSGGNEVDLTFGIAKEFGTVSVDLYYSYYNIYELGKFEEGDIHAVVAKVKWSINEMFTPYFMAEYDHIIGRSERDGLAYRLGLKVKLHKHVEVDLSGAGHTRMFGADREELSSGKVSLAFPFEFKELSITPEVNFQKRFGYESLGSDEEVVPGNERHVGLTKDNFWFGLKLAYTF